MYEKRQILASRERYPEINAENDLILSDTNLFKKDKELFFIFKKTSRLVSVAHLLTDSMSEREALKWELRRASLKSLSTVLSEKISSDENKWFDDLELSFIRFSGLVETTYLSGLVSGMNFKLIVKEISDLIKTARDYREKISQKNIGENLLWDYKGHYEEEDTILDTNRNFSKENKNRENRESSYKGQVDRFGKNQKNDTKDKKDANLNVNPAFKKEEKNSRQMEIIGIIKDKINVSIKDISEEIKDCSEKTIQRELLSMVESGVLKKEGERRWSRYSLNL